MSFRRHGISPVIFSDLSPGGGGGARWRHLVAPDRFRAISRIDEISSPATANQQFIQHSPVRRRNSSALSSRYRRIAGRRHHFGGALSHQRDFAAGRIHRRRCLLRDLGLFDFQPDLQGTGPGTFLVPRFLYPPHPAHLSRPDPDDGRPVDRRSVSIYRRRIRAAGPAYPGRRRCSPPICCNGAMPDISTPKPR